TSTGDAASCEDTADSTVTSGAEASITITPDSGSVTAGAAVAVTAEAFDGGGNSLGDVTSTTTFSVPVGQGSCLANVCTVTHAPTTTITGIHGSLQDTVDVTVSAAALDHLVLSPASPTIAA